MQDIKPLVSVIIPVYNGEKHIAQTLKSIIEQDYNNIEIILVNDASTDDTKEKAEKILNLSKRKFVIINLVKNSGVSAARNTGLNNANGKYIWFCDSDDFAEKNFVSTMCETAEKNNSDTVFCDFKHYYELKKEFENDSVMRKNFYGENYLAAWASEKIYLWSVWNFIFKKNFLDNIKLRFNVKTRIAEDTEFILKALVSAHKISYVKKMLYVYVHWPEQSTVKYNNSGKKLQNFYNIMLSRFRAGRYIIRHSDNNKIKNYVLNFFIPDAFITYITTAIKVNDRENYNRLVKFTKHKKIRELLLSTSKFIFRKPELFFKSLMLIYAPDFYYKLRIKK